MKRQAEWESRTVCAYWYTNNRVALYTSAPSPGSEWLILTRLRSKLLSYALPITEKEAIKLAKHTFLVSMVQCCIDAVLSALLSDMSKGGLVG